MAQKYPGAKVEVGDYVGRDEHIATIETDKIDVQVNSPDSGKVTELYSKEGDTVSVGGNLFKVELGNVPEPVKAAPTHLAAPPSAPATSALTEEANSLTEAQNALTGANAALNEAQIAVDKAETAFNTAQLEVDNLKRIVRNEWLETHPDEPNLDKLARYLSKDSALVRKEENLNLEKQNLNLAKQNLNLATERRDRAIERRDRATETLNVEKKRLALESLTIEKENLPPFQSYDWDTLQTYFDEVQDVQGNEVIFASDRAVAFSSKKLILYSTESLNLKQGKIPDLRFQPLVIRTDFHVQLEEFLESPSLLGLIIGPTGCGKTRAMINQAQKEFTIFVDAGMHLGLNSLDDESLGDFKDRIEVITRPWKQPNEDLSKLRAIAYAFMLSRFLFLKYLRQRYPDLTPTQFLLHHLLNSNELKRHQKMLRRTFEP